MSTPIHCPFKRLVSLTVVNEGIQYSALRWGQMENKIVRKSYIEDTYSSLTHCSESSESGVRNIFTNQREVIEANAFIVKADMSYPNHIHQVKWKVKLHFMYCTVHVHYGSVFMNMFTMFSRDKYHMTIGRLVLNRVPSPLWRRPKGCMPRCARSSGMVPALWSQ